VLVKKNKIVINNMIADAVLSLQNGYENRGIVIPYFYKTNYYDCCIKIGNDLVNQRVNYHNKRIEFKYIPILIFKNIDCLVGEDSIIDIEVLLKEINILKELRINFKTLLYISKNTCFKYRDSYFFTKEVDSSRLFKILGFVPNIVRLDNFINNYSRPLLEGSGGFYSSDGTFFNRYENSELTQSTFLLSKITYKQLGNIIGVLNIYECFNKYIQDSENILFNYLYERLESDNQLIYFDVLLNYGWVDLDKINTATKISGVNIVCVLGINVLADIEMIILKTNKKETVFKKTPDFILRIKNFIRKYLKQNNQINEIMFF
jgi:hypothetical protein